MPEQELDVDHEHLPAKLGTEFITTFSRLLRGAAIYDQKNVNIDRLAHECVQAINGIIRSQGNVFLKIVQDNFFFNNTQILVGADKYPIFKAFWQELKRRWIGELDFLEEVRGEDLKEFVYLILRLEQNNESNYLYVMKQLQDRNIRSITVGKLEFFKDEKTYVDSEDRKKYSKAVYFRSIGLMKEVVENIDQRKALNIRKAKRLMQNAVNAILQDDSTLLGLANIKNYDEYAFNHPVNVAIYAIALGQKIGIPKKQLSHLGMAGLFHDIGKTRIPKEILNKPGKLSPEEWSVVRTHPVAGTELIMRMKEWGELSTRMIEGTFEHHLRYDFTGYPRLTQKRKIGLFGRIIAVANVYDALVRPRVYNRFPYVSEKILGIMLERSGKDLDPIIVKVFINRIGIFPLGTLVLLNTNEMGIVIHIQEETDLIDRPKVYLLHYSDGEYRKEKVVDLKERDDASGDFKRSIIKTLDPNEYNINVAEFLL